MGIVEPAMVGLAQPY